MKKIVQIPLVMLICAFATALSVVGIVISVKEGIGISAANILVTLVVGGAFVLFLIKYLSRDKIEYNEHGFTVDGEAYGYDDISRADVDSEQLLRNISTLRITLFANGHEICSFTKADRGAKDFIDLIKKHGVRINIEN